MLPGAPLAVGFYRKDDGYDAQRKATKHGAEDRPDKKRVRLLPVGRRVLRLFRLGGSCGFRRWRGRRGCLKVKRQFWDIACCLPSGHAVFPEKGMLGDARPHKIGQRDRAFLLLVFVEVVI